MAKILVLVSNDLSTDQRVQKVCNSLLLAGHTPYLAGRVLPHSFPFKASFDSYRYALSRNSGPLFYWELNQRFIEEWKSQNIDLVVANDIDVIYAAHRIATAQNIPFLADFHELYPEVPELVRKPLKKQVWKWVQSYFGAKARAKITVCQSIAEWYANTYDWEVNVVRNIPQTFRGSHVRVVQSPPVVLYQGVLNKGRGIELLITAFLTQEIGAQLWIAGSGDLEQELRDMIPEHCKSIRFLGRLKPEALKEITTMASVGVSLEEELGLNYTFALPNKIFDYIFSAVPVLVSNLPEMASFVSLHNAGKVLQVRTPQEVANSLIYLLQPEQQDAHHKACILAQESMSWEMEFQTYLSQVERLLLK